MELLKALIHIQITPDQITFTGKWLLMVPFTLWALWVHWRALKSFGSSKAKVQQNMLPEG